MLLDPKLERKGFIYFYFYFICCTCVYSHMPLQECQGAHVEVRGQILGAGFLIPQ